MSRMVRPAVPAAMFAVAAIVLSPAMARPQNTSSPSPSPGAQIYADTCSGCHGANLSGGRGPSLIAALAQRSDDQLVQTITKGVPGTEMPAFGQIFSADQIKQVVSHLHTAATSAAGASTKTVDPDKQVVQSEKQTFRIDVVARGLELPWGMVFLPDGRMLVSERPGRLRIIGKDGKLSDPIKGVPATYVWQDAGFLDIALHPDYKRNGWIYLGYTDAIGGALTPDVSTDPATGKEIVRKPPSMTVIIRGKINAQNEWTDTQEIYRAPAAIYSEDTSHYGLRFMFDKQGHLFYTLGERGDMSNAQKLDNPLGKIHRINDDGSVPSDNPFVKTPGADATIWTYGNRHPQGLAIDRRTGIFWEAEHGPVGGDEINIIEPGKNYGWGVISMGKWPGIAKTSAPGMEQPIAYYTPAIAPSGIHFYTGNRYPGWTDSLFVAGLVGKQLRRLEIKGRQIVSQEVVIGNFGRIRTVITGPDGLLYLLLQDPAGGNGKPAPGTTPPGMVVRLVPLPPSG